MTLVAHAIVGFYSFETEVNHCASPVSVIVVDRNEDDIFLKNVDLYDYELARA